MPKVLCTLPNASSLISGVAFVSHANGMLSEDVTDAVAADFATIPGYTIVGSTDSADKAAAEAEATSKATAVEAEKAALLARAEVVGLKTKGNWSLERLTAEVESAERAATEAAPETTSE